MIVWVSHRKILIRFSAVFLNVLPGEASRGEISCCWLRIELSKKNPNPEKQSYHKVQIFNLLYYIILFCSVCSLVIKFLSSSTRGKSKVDLFECWEFESVFLLFFFRKLRYLIRLKRTSVYNMFLKIQHFSCWLKFKRCLQHVWRSDVSRLAIQNKVMYKMDLRPELFGVQKFRPTTY